MTNTITLEGFAAIEYAEAHGLILSKFNDPTEDARELTPDEARAVAREDARLVYVTLHCTGWTDGDGTGSDGYNVSDYFANGEYQGPDAHGIEPIMEVLTKCPDNCIGCGGTSHPCAECGYCSKQCRCAA